MEQSIRKHFEILKKENISGNVYHAIYLDKERREEALAKVNFIV